jgi:putative membrane protein
MNRHIRFLFRTLLFSLFVFSSSSFAQNTPPDVSHTPESFIQDALIRSYAILGAAEQALEQSSSQEVKAYAQRMIDDYDTITSELSALAESKEFPVQENEIQDSARNLVISEPDPQAFDVAYGKNQVPALWHIINLFQSAMDSPDGEIRQLATQNLPKIRRHLQMAEQLFAATTETKTDIYQDRKNQIDETGNESNTRIPTTERLNP